MRKSERGLSTIQQKVQGALRPELRKLKQSSKKIIESADIEICLDSDTDSQDAAPRKSPKKEKKQTAGSLPGNKEKGRQQREAHRKTPRKSAREGGCIQTDGASGHTRALSKLQMPSNDKGALPPGEDTDKLSAGKSLPALHSGDLEACLAQALPALAERLDDPAGGCAHGMPLRPSLLQVQHWLERGISTVVDNPGQNASMLVLGARGVGKTLALERAVRVLQEKYNVDSAAPRLGFVRLSGFVHTEERVAFQEIARQLCKVYGVDYVKGASAYDNLGFLREMLKEICRSERVVVFVLEEWDLFAKRSKQALLYNLLEACMAKNMQVAIIGLSCRLKAEEMLEKRLRSRFSNSWQLVVPPSVSDFDSTEESPAAVLQTMLSVDVAKGADTAAFEQQFNAASRAAVVDPSTTAALKHLCENGCCTPRDLKELAQLAIFNCSVEGSLMQARHILSAVDAVQGQVEAVSGLSVLELFLLVAIDRLRRKGKEPLNFEMAFEEYGSLRRGGAYRGADNTAPRQVARRAFDRLLSTSLVAHCDGRNRSREGLREYAAVSLTLTHEEIVEGLKRNTSAPSILLTWLEREVASTHQPD